MGQDLLEHHRGGHLFVRPFEGLSHNSDIRGCRLQRRELLGESLNSLLADKKPKFLSGDT